MKFIQDCGVDAMFLGPYSFNMAFVEQLFSYIKNRDLNPLVIRAYSKYSFSFLNLDCRHHIKTYIKELALHICKLDYSWIVSGFEHSLTAVLDGLALNRT